LFNLLLVSSKRALSWFLNWLLLHWLFISTPSEAE
jgi:hypothetical protein